MGLSLEDISLLMQYAKFNLDDIKRMPEEELLRALTAIKNWNDTGPDSHDNNLEIWGIVQATAKNT